jgi:hypothetical protein
VKLSDIATDKWNGEMRRALEDPCFLIYAGPEPFSEPETRAVRDFLLNQTLVAYISLHTYGQYILYPWSYISDGTDDVDKLVLLYANVYVLCNIVYFVHRNALQTGRVRRCCNPVGEITQLETVLISRVRIHNNSLMNTLDYVSDCTADEAPGTSMDWAKGVAGIPYSYTFELRDQGEHGFLVPNDEIASSGEEILAALFAMQDAIHSGPRRLEQL